MTTLSLLSRLSLLPLLSLRRLLPSRFLLMPVLFCLLFSCATRHPARLDNGFAAFTVPDNGTLATRMAPVFVVQAAGTAHNRIGTPEADTDPDGKEIVRVDPDKATLYFQTKQFTTHNGGTHTNLVYRAHFSEVPPVRLIQGKHVGLIVIITLDPQALPVLVTTVHTCGCYLSIFPTTRLPDQAYPDGWNRDGQAVFGETLPGILKLNHADPYDPGDAFRPVLFIRQDSHRIMDIRLSDTALPDGMRILPLRPAPMSELDQLTLPDGRTTSFFETRGCRSGYVKGSRKIWERLLMGWWAIDLRVGEDKRLGDTGDQGPVFYTSLKPWARQASDLRDFAAFLTYWNWNM